MGIYDRDYYRTPPPARLAVPAWSVTTWLIVLNVAVFLVDHVFLKRTVPGRGYYHLLEALGYFSATKAIDQWQVWRFITFQFLHADLGHLVFNMLSLYFFGRLVENYLGSRRYIAYYLLAGVGGAVLYLLLLYSRVLGYDPRIPMVGASAGIFGILLGAAYIAPNATVMMLFPPIPVKLRTLAWVFVGIAVYIILSHGRNAGGEAGHLGGAVVGYLLIRRPYLLNFMAPGRRSSSYFPNGPWRRS